ncbi:MAG: LysR family transcriptional regulator [Burkholderiaceae bacterium]
MLRELKTLIAIAREGTFAAAGERVGLTQAAVSAQMQRLEAELGFALFERQGRSVRLNKAGLRVLSQAQELIRLYERLGASSAEPVGVVSLNVGAIASVQRSLLPDALAEFHRQRPRCHTRIVPGLSIELIRLVDTAAIDMAAIIRPPFSLHNDLHWTTLAREPFRLVVPRRLRGDDWAGLLSTQPFIRYDRASFGGRQVDRFLRDRHLEPREVCEVDELEAMVQLVANGVGVALVPQTAQHHRWPAAVRAVDLGVQTFHREIGLIHRAPRTLGEAARSLAQTIIRFAPAVPSVAAAPARARRR